ncbi:dihydrofolate reductase family protein [Phycicoccus sp. BSK3Z-2]|uniref:Dihydrofolate reductase family protein n=1 Tax=Phycicoccus avicenniae TaxID=2828860 RepID=A0A941DCG6_9MICO|nr:dihydrofolate reductase family protein [Phycicoccus avicenniae]MBR7744437.1 dihydrofolate reductase family protein [Phycicoccus avicenniae]
MRRLVYLVATSLDGFIADDDGGVDAFPADPDTLAAIFAEYPETCPAHAREALGVDAPPRHFDTVLLGRRTHQPALDAGLSSGYPHLRQYVVTSRDDLPDDPTVTRVADDPVATVRALKEEDGLDVWLCGGGDLAGTLVEEIDELRLKVNPVSLGSGVPLFRGASRPVRWTLDGASALPGGVVLQRYLRG